ncbi:SRPBCC family protein [Kribbella sp. NPDC050820]|uniref:SRPBCC family protein n=1 Tax=Kribbella sp. NPDC050820 TaxID=3155408 RepID=UPI0033CAB427
MPTITNTIDISAGPDDVWAVLADLPTTRQWLPRVVSARVDGDLRVCQMADGQEVHERISELSPAHHSLRFEHVQVPLPVRHSRGTFTVTQGATADSATVTLHSTFEQLDSADADRLSDMIRGAYQQSLESLRRFIEDNLTWDAR